MNVPKNAQYIISKLHSNGHQAFVVGGCVRDALLGNEPNDWDICTSALPEKIKAIFSNHKTVDVGMKHGTIAVIVEGDTFEVTTYRTDGKYLDNRRPEDVEFVSNIEQDLLRRDFTINAMAYNSIDGLVDICGGQKDLKNKIVRTVGNADLRFGEDALRIVRALRFSATLGFEIESETEKSIFRNKSLLQNIAIERNNIEFTKMILSDCFSPTLKKFKTVVAEFFPIIEKVTDRDIDFAQMMTSEITLRLSALLKNQDFEQAIYCLKNMKYPNKTISSIMAVMSHYPIKIDSEIELKKLIGRIGLEDCVKVLRLQENSTYVVKANSITESGQCVSIKELCIDGNMLLSMGIKGKSIGETLNVLLEKVVSCELPNNKETLLDFARIESNRRKENEI